MSSPPGQPQASQPQKYSFKLVLLGESAVGKSSIVLQFVKGQFDDYRESTIGAAFLTQTVEVDDGKLVKFELWDTAGQERYRSLAPMYYRNAACAVVVYDITSPPSLTKAQTWIKELQRQADPNIIIALCGNKTDLESKRMVKKEEAQEFAKSEGLIWFECSAKTAEGVGEMFEKVAKSLPLTPQHLSTRHRSGLIGSSPSTRGGVDLSAKDGGMFGSSGEDGCAC